MDALSKVLQAVQLNGALFFDVHASDPWVAETPAGHQIVGRMFPSAQHLISYHAITRGRCWICVGTEPPMPLTAGDIVVIPHGDAHVLSTEPGMRGTEELERYRSPDEQLLPVTILVGPKSTQTVGFVCGFLGCDTRPYNPLLQCLPRAFKVSDGVGGALDAYVQIALTESKHPGIGSQSVLRRLSELMFVDVLRRYFESIPPQRRDWLAGLRDPHIGRALAAIHDDPARDWTLEALAGRAVMSRSAFAGHFLQFVGTPPMQYLNNWRMQIASRMLRDTSDSVAVIANLCLRGGVQSGVQEGVRRRTHRVAQDPIGAVGVDDAARASIRPWGLSCSSMTAHQCMHCGQDV